MGLLISLTFIMALFLFMKKQEREFRKKYPLSIPVTTYPEYHEYSMHSGVFNLH